MSGRVTAPIAPAAVAEFKPGPTDREFDRETRRLALEFAVRVFQAQGGVIVSDDLVTEARFLEAYLLGLPSP